MSPGAFPNGTGAAGSAPKQPAAKGSAATPKLNSQDMEMGDLPGNDATPAQPDIMLLARVGDIPGMEKLFESSDYDATYTDDEGITPLHWAAINNQYAMCKFLIDKGADINRKGGQSVATPLQWAAGCAHYYTVDLLLQHGADPLITDVQGYNTLHISTFSGNVLLVTLLLHQGIPVDVADSSGYTSLMWAAYKGFPQCVDLFLRWGASVHATDEQGFRALHWALVKGSVPCILNLIEYGADRFAKTHTGKTPATVAKDLNTIGAWHLALKECGYDEDGHAVIPWWPGASYFLKDKRTFTNKLLFLLPTVMIWTELMVVSHLPVFLSVFIALFVFFGFQWGINQVLEYAPPDMRPLHKTPWLAGIFSGSLLLAGVQWLLVVATATYPRHPLINLLFLVSYGFTVYFYAASMTFDPGFVPKLNGIAEQKAVIDELLRIWKYDESNFCVSCMIRTPLRSKHCRRCQRCVAKHDHHCPWINNCVGANNHRHFFVYLINLVSCVLIFDWLLYYYFSEMAKPGSPECLVLSASFCKVVNSDPYMALLGVWANLQLTWVGMLIFVQLVQVAQAMTTFENRYGIQDGSNTFRSAFTSTGAPLDPSHPDAAAPSSTANGPLDARKGHHGHKHRGFLQQWSRLLGVDTFLETASGKKVQKKNPYSQGYVQNCRDFWCDPAPIFGRRENGEAMFGGVQINYTKIYESPAVMRLGVTARRRGEYEAVANEEV
ncbi:hypothetical protein GGS21DRAFT_498194 [Xylaria nigripes]|nr:hypothetical protein GGS21DRAFT_498194 [Xylaria nigripes]